MAKSKKVAELSARLLAKPAPDTKPEPKPKPKRERKTPAPEAGINDELTGKKQEPKPDEKETAENAAAAEVRCWDPRTWEC